MASIQRIELPTIATLAVASLLAPGALSQPPERVEEYLTRGRVPHYADKYRAALGDRVDKPGKERVSVSGTLTAQGRSVPATIRWEVPGRFRLDQTGGGRPLLLNGPGLALGRTQNSLDETEEALAESLLFDRSESILYFMANGGSARLVGEQVRQGPNLAADYAGPYFDVVDVVARVDARPSSPARQKRYLFDSFSGLLQRVLYRVAAPNGVENSVETVFEQWTTVDGHPFPLVVERRMNGSTVLRFQATIHTLSAKGTDGAFDNP